MIKKPTASVIKGLITPAGLSSFKRATEELTLMN